MSNYLYWAAGLLLLLVLALIVAKRRSSKIDQLPPEHRAKENELYEAFGLEVPHKKEAPKGHDEKKEEVEAAFSSKKKAGKPRKKTTAKKKTPAKKRAMAKSRK